MEGKIQIAATEPSRTAPSLPTEVVRSTARRLATAAWMIAAGYALYFVLYRTVWADQDVLIGAVSGVVGVGVSVATALLLRRELRPRTITGIGLGYELILTANIAVVEFAAGPVTQYPMQQVSWTCVLIVLFPFLIPGRPRTLLFGSLAAAAMLPLGWLVSILWFDRALEPIEILLSHFLPGFVCAVVAYGPATVLHRMGTDVGRARQLGSYELVEKLGAGGMGEVWRARHRFLARPAAIKLIKPEVLGARDAGTSDAVIRRFEREAQITASLESPHTIELYDFGVSTGGDFYYVMELLRGMDLQTMVDRFGPMPPERVVHLLLQACDSLADAHVRGLVHRDVKPANLYVARKGVRHDVLKVLDFGLVKRWASDPLESLALAGTLPGEGQTQAGVIVGTPAYLPPEAATGARELDHRGDLYALGCVGYFMLTGKPVFDAPNAMAMALAHVTRTPEDVSRVAPGSVPADLAAAVMQCLEKDPDARPEGARELARSLACCASASGWSEEQAAEWWSRHVPELTSLRPQPRASSRPDNAPRVARAEDHGATGTPGRR